MRSPYCWKYKASPCPSPCRTPCPRPAPCSPCRPVCTSCPPPVTCCRPSPDDCFARERFSSSCSPLYTGPPPCVPPIDCCCPRERFASSCSSPTAQPTPSTACPDTTCDLDSYCVKSSPFSCNPCLGRRSFRHCSSFTRRAIPYCNWCRRCGRDVVDDDGDSRRKKRGRKSTKERDDRSTSANTNIGRSSSRASPADDTKKSSGTLSDLSRRTEPTFDEEGNRWIMPKGKKDKSKNSRTSNSNKQKSTSRSSLKARTSVGDVDNSEGRRSSSAVDAPVEENAVEDDQRASRKSSALDLGRRSSSKTVGFDNDVDVDEVRPSCSNRASRKSSCFTNDNVRRGSSGQSSFVDDDDDDDDADDEPRQSVADRRRSSSVTSAPRASPHSFTSDDRQGRKSSTPGSRSSDVGRKLSNMRARFASKAKSFSLKSKFRRRQTPFRPRRSAPSPSPSAESTSRSSTSKSSRSSINRNRRSSSTMASGDECANSLVKPLAECLAGIIHKSVAGQCDPCNQRERCCGQIRLVSHPPGYCYDGRCSANAWNPRDRFSLRSTPFYRSGHRVFPVTTKRQSAGASVAAYGGRQSAYGGAAEFVPDAQGAGRRTSMTTSMTAAGTQARSTTSRLNQQNASFIGSMPPPGTSVPRATISTTSGRHAPTAPPPSRPPFVGYREHYVTTTNQTVRLAHEQNYSSNAPARRPSDNAYHGADNRNRSGATSASSNFLGDVVSGAVQTSSPPSATERAGRTSNVSGRELAAMFDEAERDIMKAFDNTQQILR